MNQFTKIYYVAVVVNCICGTFADEADRFSYDAQLLEKMVRMEVSMQQMQKEMNETKANVKSALERVTRVLNNKTAELKLFEDKVDMPMVAFNAHKPLDLSMDTNQILILQNVTLNKGEGYDNVLGVFTAPVTGLYYFTAHTCNYAGRGFYFHIILEHSPIAKSTKSNNVQHDCGSVSTVTMMTEGQRVWIKCASGNSNNQLSENPYRQTSFSGFLLQK